MIKPPIPESYWAGAENLLAGEYPGGADPESARRRIDALLEAGIDAFIDLTEPRELDPYKDILEKRASALGVEVSYQRISIHDFGTPSSDVMTTILDAMGAAMDSGKRVYLHCRGGVGRTGMVIGCHFVRRGATNEQALEKVRELYGTRPASRHQPRSPETDEQVDFVLNWWEDAGQVKGNSKKFCEG